MNLLITYTVCVLIGQAIVVGIGLAVDRTYSSYAGLMAFIPLYFVMFVIAWKIAIRLTEPKTRPPRVTSR